MEMYFQRVFDGLRKRLRLPAKFFEALWVPTAPFAIALMAGLAFWLPDQSREIFRDYALDISRWATVIEKGGFFWHDYLPSVQTLLGFGTMFLASYLVWRLARQLTLLILRHDLVNDTARGYAARWIPRICGVLIPLGAGLSNYRAAGDAADVAERLILLLAAAVSFLFAVCLFAWSWWRSKGARAKNYMDAPVWAFEARAIGTFALLTIGAVVLFCPPLLGTVSIRAAQLIGTPAIFCIFVALLVYWATVFSAVRARFKLPVAAGIVIWLAILSWSGLSANHDVDVLPRKSPAQAQQPIKAAFKAWYAARADREAYEKASKPYPVFLISVAGGGLYAADFAATALGRVQDGCPGFAQHVFAISGVSGGGLGAAVFSRLLAGEEQVTTADMRPGTLDPCVLATERPAARLSLESRARLFLTADFLAPIAAAAFFPDFAQRFLPFPVRAFDRSRAFEMSLDMRWRDLHERLEQPHCGGDCAPFSKPFLGHWSPDGVAPALVFNATDVDLGYRVATAPFAVSPLPTKEQPIYVPSEYSALIDFHPKIKDGDVTIGAAISMSARFPWLLPPATFVVAHETDASRTRRMRLIDGGLFENSGVDTLRDMLFELQDFERMRPGEPWVVFHPIVISGYQLNVPGRETGFQGELAAPITAMLKTRVQRAGMASYRLFKERGYHCGTPEQVDLRPYCNYFGGMRFLVLNHEDHRLPLGWHLSKPTREVIERHIGEARGCAPIPRIARMFIGENVEVRKKDTIAENNCTACAMRTMLSARTLAEGRLCHPVSGAG